MFAKAGHELPQHTRRKRRPLSDRQARVLIQQPPHGLRIGRFGQIGFPNLDIHSVFAVPAPARDLLW
jgi:hypothetical protein